MTKVEEHINFLRDAREFNDILDFLLKAVIPGQGSERIFEQANRLLLSIRDWLSKTIS